MKVTPSRTSSGRGHGLPARTGRRDPTGRRCSTLPAGVAQVAVRPLQSNRTAVGQRREGMSRGEPLVGAFEGYWTRQRCARGRTGPVAPAFACAWVPGWGPVDRSGLILPTKSILASRCGHRVKVGVGLIRGPRSTRTGWVLARQDQVVNQSDNRQLGSGERSRVRMTVRKKAAERVAHWLAARLYRPSGARVCLPARRPVGDRQAAASARGARTGSGLDGMARRRAGPEGGVAQR